MSDAQTSGSDELDYDLSFVVDAMLDGRLVPFFGAGVNRCDRPMGAHWEPDKYLPDGGELSTYLLSSSATDAKSNPEIDQSDLLRVSQYIATMEGTGPLYEKLRGIFNADYPLTSLRRFFAELPSLLRQKHHSPRFQLIVTTNYDDLLERAFREVSEPFDLAVYIAEGDQRGKFWHFPPEGEPILVDRPNEYLGLDLNQRAVVLKIHGTVNRANQDGDSYVITEHNYIDYLTHADISSLIPVKLAAALRKSHFLFLATGCATGTCASSCIVSGANKDSPTNRGRCSTSHPISIKDIGINRASRYWTFHWQNTLRV